MNKSIKFLLIAVLGVALASCSMMGGGEKPEYRLSDLQGLWLQTNDTTEHYVRFTTEQSDEAKYLYGREWHENDPKGAVYEQDLFEQREFYGYPGDGWFKYLFETTGSLTEIHLMDNGGADIPKIYVVSKLTSTDLEYYEKEKKTNKFYFTKVVEK